MTGNSTRMFAEAAEAAAAVRDQRAANAQLIADIAARLRANPPAAVLTCARGSSDHAATYAKYLIETRIGTLVSSASPSVSSLYNASPANKHMLCIAISQSGRSPDLIATVEAAKSVGAAALALVNAPGSPLGEIADMLVPLHAGPEISVAATKSYIAALAAMADLVAAWGEDDALDAALDTLPDLLAQAWQADWSALVDRLADARGLYVIGRGVGLGIAQEAALKFKETCGLHAEAFSAAEVRHGPMALVGPDFPLRVFRQSDETEAGIDDLIAEAISRGAPVLVTGEGPGAIPLPSVAAHPAIEPILQIQSFYRAANALSLRRGFDPDRPPNLRKVTETV
jgi:glucosamine--fructose-6-phosphate aminotransferase (isomerizing)